METGAVAMVAATNNIPFIAFRSLSDLAGAETNSTNQIDIFLNLATYNSITVLTNWLYYAYCDGYIEPFESTEADSIQLHSYSLFVIILSLFIAITRM